MNQFRPLASLLILLLTFVSCKEEIEVTAKYKETPIIFGLLDQSEELHYIRINRGFVGPGNALEFAKIPDSNYFEKVDARIDELVGDKVMRTWNLRDTILNNKSTTGAFYAPEHKMYYFSTANEDKLRDDANYRLTVNINDGKVIVTGETKLVSGFAENNSLSSQTNSLKFAKLPGELISQSITFNKGTSAFADARLDIVITEYRGAQKDTITIPFKVFEGLPTGSVYSTSAQGQAFYPTIKNGLTNDNTITKRNLEGIKFTFTGGATEFLNYTTVSKPSSSLSQTKPTYTNLKATNGHQVLGLFSSRKSITFYKSFVNLNQNGQQTSFRAIDKNSTRELCQGTTLIESLFCSQHVNDSNDDFFCN